MLVSFGQASGHRDPDFEENALSPVLLKLLMVKIRELQFSIKPVFSVGSH